MRAGWTIGLVLVLLGALAVRVDALRSAFWVDEIFSLEIARSCHSAAEVFVTASDNNHPLNTLWMYLLGEQRDWTRYRAPALVCGMLVVFLLALSARRDGPEAAMIAAILGGASWLMVQYATEARGYAMAMAISLTCLALMQAYIERPRRAVSLAFALIAALGPWAQASFLYVYPGFVVWSVAALWRSPARWRDMARLHAVPLASAALAYVLFLRPMTLGGGFAYPSRMAAIEAIGWTFGWPGSGVMTVALCAAVGGMACAELLRLARQGDRHWTFYAWAIVLGPAMALLAWRQPYVYPRYFALPAVLLLLVVARYLAEAWRSGGGARIGAAIFIFLVIWGNARQCALFGVSGRGQYAQALRYMAANSAERTVGSTQDRRNRMVIGFFRPYVASPLEYVELDRGPMWLIDDHPAWEQSPRLERNIGSRRYRLARVFRYYGLSGLDWWVYRRTDATSTTEPPRP